MGGLFSKKGFRRVDVELFEPNRDDVRHPGFVDRDKMVRLEASSKAKTFFFFFFLTVVFVISCAGVVFTFGNRTWLYNPSMDSLFPIIENIYVPGYVHTDKGLVSFYPVPGNLISKTSNTTIAVGSGFENEKISLNSQTYLSANCYLANGTQKTNDYKALSNLMKLNVYHNNESFIISENSISDSCCFDKSEVNTFIDVIQLNLHLIESIKDLLWINVEIMCQLKPVLPECQCSTKNFTCLCEKSPFFHKKEFCS